MKHRILESASLLLEYDVPEGYHPRYLGAGPNTGLKNQAVVYSMDFVSQLSTAEVLRGITGGTFAGFDDAATARRALLSS